MRFARCISRVPRAARRAGFTLIELMVVMGIMAIVMTMGVPIVYRATHRVPMTRAVNDVVEVLANARRFAIFRGQPYDVVFHPQERTLEVVSAGTSSAPRPQSADPGALSANVSAPGSGLSAQISDHVQIDMLDVNLTEYSRSELARVRFHPNGMCDEMTLILRSTDNGEQRGIVLEITTGLATILNERDLQDLRNGRL